MSRALRRPACVLALALGLLVPAPAPRAAPVAEAPPQTLTPGPQIPESFEIGLSTDTITITSNFNGTKLVVFGALDNADGRILRQGGYDIVVALEGPKLPIVVREKARVLGLWINSGSESFTTAPSSYSLAATRRLGDIAPQKLLTQLSVGIENLRLGESEKPPAAGIDRDEYAGALRRIRSERGLYNQSFGTVEFVSATLFRAELTLPPDLPVGRHVARALLFRQGVFIAERTGALWVRKAGFESAISNAAERSGLLYGVMAVALAILTGWLGRLVFKRD